MTAARGALARAAVGLVLGLALAEVTVRAVGLGPVTVPRLRTLENAAKSFALDCYPEQGARPEGFPVDLRRERTMRDAVSSGLDRGALAAAAAETPLCVAFTYNAWTRRDAPFAPTPGARSVLVVGDSFTEGAGVPEDDVFVAALQRALDAEAPTRVWNGGRRGFDQPALVGSLATLLPVVKPDVVLYALVLNDIEQDRAWAARQAFLNDLILDRQRQGAPGWKLPALLGWSRLAVFVAASLRTARASAETIAWYQGMTGPENAGGWARTKVDLAEMRAISEAAGAELVVAVLPLLVGLDRAADYPFDAVHEDLAAACAELGIAHLDLTAALLGRDPRTLHVHPVDMHPNAAAHGLIGEALVPAVRAALER